MNKPISITVSVPSDIDMPIHAAYLYREDGKYVAYFKYAGKTHATKVYEHMSLSDVQEAIDTWAIALRKAYEESIYAKQ